MKECATRWLPPVVLAVACVISRWGSLQLPTLNVDEAQYSAFAAYLTQSNQSALEMPFMHVYTQAIYHVLATLFGDYDLTAPRALALLLCFLTAWQTYRLGLRMMPWPWALWAASLFIFLSVFCDGLTANREWFCLPLVLLPMSVLIARDEREGGQRWLFALAGFAAASTFWLKEQSVVMAAPIVVELLLRCRLREDRSAAIASLAWYSVGGLAGILVPVIPMLAYGKFGIQVEWLWRIELGYATEAYPRNQVVEFFQTVWGPLYVHSPWRRLWIVGLASAIGILLRGYWIDGSTDSRRGLVQETACRCVAVYLLCAFLVVQAGGRFFMHYYLFPLPAVVLLVVYTAWRLCFVKQIGFAAIGSGLLLVVWIADLLWVQSDHATLSMGPTFASQAWRVAVVLAALAIGVVVRIGVSNAARVVALSAAAAIAIEASVESVYSFLQTQTPTFSAPSLAEAVRSRARSGDRLFLWGWRPEVYLDARLPAATRFAACLEVVAGQDHQIVLEPRFDPVYARMLLDDLDRYRPRFFVDATVCSIIGAQYNLPFVPPLAEYVNEHYRLIDSADGCDLYERFDGPSKNSATATSEETLHRRLKELDRLVRRFPENMLNFQLNRCDLLAQAGKFDEARHLCMLLRRILPYWSILESRVAVFDRLRSPAATRDALSRLPTGFRFEVPPEP